MKEGLQSEIEKLKPWFHNIHLPDGTQTAPDHFLGDFPSYKWDKIAPLIPEDLEGWNVLDIGCNAGYYTIELAKRGANVLAIDIDTHYLDQAAWVAKQYGLEERIEFRQMQVYDLPRLDRKFDLVWYMGVMYHLRYPLLSLDIVSQKVKKLLVFQTLTMPGCDVLEAPEDIGIHGRNIMLKEGWPKMAFIENRLQGDATNWWAPNHACIEAMLRSCGLQVTSQPEDETYLCQPFEAGPEQQSEWNLSEYLSATGQEWKEEIIKKTGGKNHIT